MLRPGAAPIKVWRLHAAAGGRKLDHRHAASGECRAEGIASGLKVRHDHGSQYVADDFQRELAFPGIASSPAFVRQPEGNGCVERFIRNRTPAQVRAEQLGTLAATA